jgi:ATP-binding cassette, subfamily B, bacterial PglK
MNLYKKIKAIIPKSEVNKIYLLFFGVVVSSAIETIGVGIILPFISLINDPLIFQDYPTIMNLFLLNNITDHNDMIVISAILILFILVSKNIYLFYFLKFQMKFIHESSAKCSVNLLRKYLSVDYLYHLQTNSSVMLRNMKSETSIIFSNVIMPLTTLITEILLMILVISLLVFVEPTITILGMTLIGGVSILFYKSIKVKNNRYGELRIIHEKETFKWINHSLGGIKDIKLLGKESYFIKYVDYHYAKLARINVFEYLISQAPRLFLESLIVVGVMIMIIFLILNKNSSTDAILPTLALFAVSAFRLMPATNRILGSFIALKFAIPSVDVIYNNYIELNTKYNSILPSSVLNYLDLSDGIQLRNISFRYPQVTDYALENISLDIPRNKSIGIMGASGSGKSTLLNILLGFIKPTSGTIVVDSNEIFENISTWQRMLGFVPQEIFLIDDSIKKNIAYGTMEEDIDESRLWNALELAQLDIFVKSLPDGLDTYAGENGMRISGGQRQRIGIARALYHNPEILIFDEATSALDNETEQEITKSIENLSHKKTIIIVAHRLSTLAKCDLVYKLDKGNIQETSL